MNLTLRRGCPKANKQQLFQENHGFLVPRYSAKALENLVAHDGFNHRTQSRWKCHWIEIILRHLQRLRKYVPIFVRIASSRSDNLQRHHPFNVKELRAEQKRAQSEEVSQRKGDIAASFCRHRTTRGRKQRKADACENQFRCVFL